MIQGILFIAVYVLTIPCIILHLWIIFACIFPKGNNKTVRCLEANLSFGSVLHQLVVGYFLAALHFNCLWVKEYCGLRMCIKAIPLAIVTFTLVKITTERIYVLRNLFYRPIDSTIITIAIINSLAVFVSIPIVFTRSYDPTTSKQSKCVTGYLFDSLAWDWIYRIFMFLILCMIPSVILLREIRDMVKLMQSLTFNEAEGELKEKIQVQQERDFNLQRLRLMKSACVFSTLFVCYSLPIGIIETLDSAAISLPEIIRYYQAIIRDMIYLVGYLIVTICPIVMHHANKDIDRMNQSVYFAYSGVYILLIPCIFTHLWIIFVTVFRNKKQKAPVNYLEANLSFGSLLNQLVNGFFILTTGMNIWSEALCGTRTYCKAIPLAIVTFTLVNMTMEQIYISRKLYHSSLRLTLIKITLIDISPFIFCMPIVFSKRYDPTSSISSKCVKKFFMDSEEMDWVCRIFLMIVLTVIPAILLLREMGRIAAHMKEFNSGDIEQVKLQGGEMSMKTYKLMKSATKLIIIFVSYSAPLAIMETLDSPSIEMPKSVRYYKSMAQHLLYLTGYIIITIFPICMYKRSRHL